MTLKMVTWEGDFTQFLVNADTDSEAIAKSIKANFKYCSPGDDDENEVEKNMRDPTTYSVEDVNFDLLCEIFERTDICGKYEDAVVFNG